MAVESFPALSCLKEKAGFTEGRREEGQPTVANCEHGPHANINFIDNPRASFITIRETLEKPRIVASSLSKLRILDPFLKSQEFSLVPCVTLFKKPTHF